MVLAPRFVCFFLVLAFCGVFSLARRSLVCLSAVFVVALGCILCSSLLHFCSLWDGFGGFGLLCFAAPPPCFFNVIVDSDQSKSKNTLKNAASRHSCGGFWHFFLKKNQGSEKSSFSPHVFLLHPSLSFIKYFFLRLGLDDEWAPWALWAPSWTPWVQGPWSLRAGGDVAKPFWGGGVRCRVAWWQISVREKPLSFCCRLRFRKALEVTTGKSVRRKKRTPQHRCRYFILCSL